MTRKSDKLAGKKVLFLSSTDFGHRTREFREAMTLHDAGADVTVYGYATEVPELWANSPIKSEVFIPETRGNIASENSIWVIRVFLNLTVNIVRRAIRKYTARKIEMRRFINRGVKIGPDVVHAMDLPSLKDAALVAKKAKAMLVYDCSEYWRGFVKNPVFDNAKRSADTLLKQEQKFIKCAKLVLTTSETMNSRFLSDYNVKNTVCLYNAPICNGVYPVPEQVTDVLKLVFHGNIGPDRNLSGLLQAMAEASEDITLDIYGNFILEAKENCERIIRENNLSNRVTFHGQYVYGEMLSFLPKYDVEFYAAKAVDGNFDVTLPNKIFDCICAGLAMVVPEFQSMHEILSVVQNGRMIDTNSKEELIEILIWLSQNKTKVMEYKQEAHAHADLFSWEYQAAKLNESYESLF